MASHVYFCIVFFCLFPGKIWADTAFLSRWHVGTAILAWLRAWSGPLAGPCSLQPQPFLPFGFPTILSWNLSMLAWKLKLHLFPSHFCIKFYHSFLVLWNFWLGITLVLLLLSFYLNSFCRICACFELAGNLAGLFYYYII